MKSSALVCLLFVAACASNGAGPAGSGDQSGNIKHVMLGQNLELGADAQSNTPAAWRDIAAAAPRTWQLLPIAYKKLGLSITRYDSTNYVIEGERLRSRSDFGGKQLTSLMNCGDVAGMPNVTRFDVNIEVRTALKGAGSTSSIASVVTASAKPSDVSGILMPCVVNTSAGDQVTAAVNDALKSGAQ